MWCQFAMTIFYYPSLLAYMASTSYLKSVGDLKTGDTVDSDDHH